MELFGRLPGIPSFGLSKDRSFKLSPGLVCHAIAADSRGQSVLST